MVIFHNKIKIVIVFKFLKHLMGDWELGIVPNP